MFDRRNAMLGLLALGATPALAGRPPQGRRHAERDGPPPATVTDLVIGSGYGGSILARRLAESGRQVVVLERGREWLPGQFPSNWASVLEQMYNPVTAPNGLLELIGRGDLDVVCGSGLGGTSLLNAAICMRPDRVVLDRAPWPEAIRAELGESDLGTLGAFYRRAELALRATRDPRARDFRKVQLLKRAADLRSRELGRPIAVETLPLAITHVDGRNPDGVRQRACTACGDCCTGCNVGAKNVLTTNYIPAARARGARFFTGVGARWLEPHPDGGFRVHVTWTPRKLGLPQRTEVHAQRVFLAAGSAGSTRILLRSRDRGLALSDALGSRLSANGDVLALAYNSPHRTDNLGFGPKARSRHLDRGYAPGQIISSNANYRTISTSPELIDHFNVLDGAVPMPSAAPLAFALAQYALAAKEKFPQFDDAAWERVRRDVRAGLDFRDLHPDGAMNHSMLYLACGHDSSGGRYELTGQALTTRWDGLYQEPSIRRIEDELRAHAAALQAAFVPNPRTAVFEGQMMATHPLGGAPMGDAPDTGVVDHLGRCFRPDGSVREDLFVVDGAIVPTSLGATPLLTISALAERIAASVTRA